VLFELFYTIAFTLDFEICFLCIFETPPHVPVLRRFSHLPCEVAECSVCVFVTFASRLVARKVQ